MHLLLPGSGLVIRTQTGQLGIAAMKTQISGQNTCFPTAGSDISHTGVFVYYPVNRIALDEKLLHLSRCLKGGRH